MIPILFGAHLSLGRSPLGRLREAQSFGVQAAQIFASSPGAWKSPVFEDKRYKEIRDGAAAMDISPIVIHAIYLINLASADQSLRAKSRASLVETLHAAQALGVTCVTTHIGSHGGRGFSDVAPLVVEGILDILNRTPGAPVLALENSAGAGNIIGSTLEELAELLKLAGRPDRLRVTLDTAHLCGAGWDLKQPDMAQRLVHEIGHTIGLDRLALLHVNDSRAECGSRRDRHEVIGEGHIGEVGFRHLLVQPELRRVPWVLETPDLGEDDVDLRFRSLARLARIDAEIRGQAHAGISDYDADTVRLAGV